MTCFSKIDANSRLERLRTTLDQLLDVPYSLTADNKNRQTMSVALIRNELLSFLSVEQLKSEDVATHLSSIDDDQMATIECRCLFYAADELVHYLAKRQLQGSLAMIEEAVLYVQDRLQRDDFRRIRNYQVDQNASFKTYIWQVIKNLLIDFVRSFNNRASKLDQSKVISLEGSIQEFSTNGTITISDPPSQEENTDSAFEQQQLSELLSDLLGGTESVNETEGLGIRARLRAHLALSNKERLFLKAMFVHDLTIAEIRKLPGFEMGLNEAYRYYYQLMQQLTLVFKEADVVDELRSLVQEEQHLLLEFDGGSALIAVAKIFCLQKHTSDLVLGYALKGDQLVSGWVKQQFSKLKKQFASYYSEVDSRTLVADHLLREQVANWDGKGSHILNLPHANIQVLVKGRYLKTLRRQFAKKNGDGVRISTQEYE